MKTTDQLSPRLPRLFPILVAEDDSVNAEVIRSVLSEAGFPVTVARDGLEAWQQLQHQQFQLLIVDIAMPGMRGDTLIMQARSLVAYADVPVILVTAKAFEIDVEDLKVAEVFHKPFSPAALVEAVHRTFNAAPMP